MFVPLVRVGKGSRGAEGGIRLGLHSCCHLGPRESFGREDISVCTSCECGQLGSEGRGRVGERRKRPRGDSGGGGNWWCTACECA